MSDVEGDDERQDPPREHRNKLRIALGLGLAPLAALLVYALVLLVSLPDVSYLAHENPTETALMRERGGEAVQHWIPLDRISESLVQAVIMAEDAGFYGHEGFDIHEIEQAFKRNWEEGRTVRGASTITQQLAKNLFLTTERSYLRKLKEAILTRRLEKELTKDRILELYLNVIEWGDGIYGAEAASQQVFGKSAADLSVVEAATLAAMIPNPFRLDPCKSPHANRTRRDRILRWMHMAKHIDDEELRRALASSPQLRHCN
jgi:monofunctional biosynthetic peptidoglycan transglycosylase